MQLVSLYPDSIRAERHIKVLDEDGEIIGHIKYSERKSGTTGFQFCPLTGSKYPYGRLCGSIKGVLTNHLKLPEPQAEFMAQNFQTIIERQSACPAH